MSGRLPRVGTGPIRFSGSRVGIGTTPDASSILDVSSTALGFLPPRMTTIQRDAISSPATGLVIYNTTTDLLNVYDGTSWGTVMPTVDTADQGYFFGFVVQNPAAAVLTSGASFVGTANQVEVFQFVLPFRVVVGNIVSEIRGAGAAGKKYSVGLYTAAKDLLVHTGALAADAIAVNKTAISPTVTVEPGVYYFAQTTDDAATVSTRIDTSTLSTDLLLEGSSPKIGRAANASVAGVLPATLGTITSGITRNPIVVIFEP